MRTTLTLDDDVTRLVREEVRRSGGTFKGTVNNLIRRGLTAGRDSQPRKRFVVTPIAMNLGLGTRYEKVEHLIEALEGPMHR